MKVYRKRDAERMVNNIITSVLPLDESDTAVLDGASRKKAETLLLGKLNSAQGEDLLLLYDEERKEYSKRFERKGTIEKNDKDTENLFGREAVEFELKGIDKSRRKAYNKSPYVQWKSVAIDWANRDTTKVGDRNIGSDGYRYYVYEAIDKNNSGRADDYVVVKTFSTEEKYSIYWEECRRIDERTGNSIYEGFDGYEFRRSLHTGDIDNALSRRFNDGRNGGVPQGKTGSNANGNNNKSNGNQRSSYEVVDRRALTPIAEKFTDIAGRNRIVLKIGKEYMVEDTPLIKRFFSTIDAAIQAENENIIKRYSQKKIERSVG